MHRFWNYFKKDGNIAYVQIFAVKKNNQQFLIAEKLYKEAENITKRINCNKISVVIYSSPLEEKVLNKLNYKIERRDLKWEIYPKQFVDCKIYMKE